MDNSGPETLPLPQRLALTYAPAKSREDVLTLMLLDNRLAGILRQRGEVMIAQIKLAWWRDRLGEDRASWPQGEPLLARLAQSRVDLARYIALVDGWEELLSDELGDSGMSAFANGRAEAWAALAGAYGTEAGAADAARRWSLVDLAHNLGQEEEAGRALALAQSAAGKGAALPKAVRPLAVLDGLARRSLARGGDELINGPGAAVLALRIGLTGR